MFSPGKVEHDRQILIEVSKDLARQGFVTTFVRGEELSQNHSAESLVLAMCQSERALQILDGFTTGIVINTPAAIRNCYRHAMIPLLQKAGVPLPETTLQTTDAPFRWTSQVWLKRGDVHAVEPGDVVFAEDSAAAERGLEDMRRRGVQTVCIQKHIPGTTLKFYGVADGSFFQIVDPAPDGFDQAAAKNIAMDAARALGLDVFGGDFLVFKTGKIYLVDVNDWPSFSRCRPAAARAIACYAAGRALSWHRS
jgi:glutathione synthase/RimK-type ligase-like ATP-grasp enzyme